MTQTKFQFQYGSIGRHYASDIQATERSKQQKEALDLFNQLTAKA